MIQGDLVLHVSPEQLVVQAPGDATRPALYLDRVTHELRLGPLASGSVDGFHFTERRPIAGIIGLLTLPSGPHLIVARDRIKIGDVTPNNHGLFRMVAADIVPLAKSTNHLSVAQAEENQAFLTMMEQVLATPYFYFSHSTDLTHTLQRKSAMGHLNVSVISLFTKCDPRFVWNQNLLKSFYALGEPALQYCLPLLHGVIYTQKCSLNGKFFRWTLIARRSTRRAGVRYFRRGCDEWGQCANFVESEQIVEHGQSISSFVQTRGSIPLFWSQDPNVKDRKPAPKLDTTKNHLDAFSKHFMEQQALYGAQTMINLIDHQKAEGDLESHVKAVHQTSGLPNVQYLAFDFHSECPALNWEKLYTLIRNLVPQLALQSMFYQTTSGGALLRQVGVFRTNCIDCLDRTNVVQSLLFRENIQDALMKMGVLGEGDLLHGHPMFMTIFNNVMADVGDTLSIQYAGTGALKTDFTRSGKRTFQGMMSDLKFTIVRYFKNNFSDGTRQDAIDLFLGTYKFMPGTNTAYAEPIKTTPLHNLLPICMLLTLAMFLLTAINSTEWDQGTIMYLFFWLGSFSGVCALLRRNAAEYVNRPILIPS